MTDLKITLNAYAVIERNKFWQGECSWSTIKTVMIPEEQRKHFFIDPNTNSLENKLQQRLTEIDFLPVITQVKNSYDVSKEPLEELKDLLMTIYVELQDVKANTEDDKLLDLLQHIDSELVTAAKIVAAIMKEEDQDK